MNTSFNRWILETTGLHMTPEKQSQIDAALTELARTYHISVERCLHQLMSGKLQRDRFIDLITTPESYFLRHEKVMAHVVTKIIPKILQTGRRVRILSLPCARGEEPFTMAMMLLDHGINPQLVEIIGADISGKRIAEAKAAIYTSHSLRRVPADFQHRHFVPSGSKSFKVRQNLIGSVRFLQANLLQDALGKIGRGVDIIFCHNLFIYFNKPTIQQALEIFWELLSGDGWFFVDPTEIPHVSRTFQRVDIGKNSGFRKKKVESSQPLKKQNRGVPAGSWPKHPTTSREGQKSKPTKRISTKTAKTKKATTKQQKDSADLWLQASTCYQSKELDRAHTLFEKLLKQKEWQSKAHLGLAMVCSDRGRQIEAIEHAEAVLSGPSDWRKQLTASELGELHAIVAVTLFNKGLHTQGKLHFEELQKLAPQHEALHLYQTVKGS